MTKVNSIPRSEDCHPGRTPSARLRLRRLALGIPQRELAIAVGVSREQVNNLENGRCLPRVDTAIRLADVLGLDVREMFPTDDVSPAGRPGTRDELTIAGSGDDRAAG